MTEIQRDATIVQLKSKLLDALGAYVLAIRTREKDEVKNALYNVIQEIKKEIRELKHPADTGFIGKT